MKWNLFRRLFLILIILCFSILYVFSNNKGIDLNSNKSVVTENILDNQLNDEESIIIDNDKEDLTDDLTLDDINDISLEEAFLYENGVIYKDKQEKIDDLYYSDELNKILDKSIINLIASPVRDSLSNTVYKQTIPIVMNEYVDKQIDYFLTKRSDFFIKSLERAKPFINEMKMVFKEYNLPEELAYLPLIESGYQNYAISRKGAVGMWQFMPKTAKWIGLKVNPSIDERRDPIIACRYAAKFLNFLYQRFGDWYLVLAAYNHGGTNILKEMKKANSSNYYDLVKKKMTPNETRNYIPRYIASLILIKNIDSYYSDYKEEKTVYEYYKLPFMTPAHLVAKYSQMNLNDFMKLNAAIKDGFVPEPKYNYMLRLPKENYDILMANMDLLKKDSSLTYIPYYVKKGDTLSEISANYRVSVSLLMSINNLKSSNKLSIGQRIFLPVRGYQVNDKKN